MKRDLRTILLLIYTLSSGSAGSALAGDEKSPGKAKRPAAKMDPVSRQFLLPEREYLSTPRAEGLEAEEVSFRTRSGALLRGWFFDRKETRKTVLVCMGNAGNISYMLSYARILLDGGFDVLLFEYQGFGQSEGTASLMSLTRDASAAFDYLTSRRGLAPRDVGVLGISLGSVLALYLGANRETRAVAVEDVFLPSDHIRELKKSQGDDALARWAITAIEKFLLPAVDPLSSSTRIRCPVFLLHEEKDPLLPPSGTIRVARACKTPPRIWFLRKTGHAPESLEVNDREFAHQITRFFRETFESDRIDDPRLDYSVEEADGAFDVTLTVECAKRQPLQITLAGDGGKFHFVRTWAKAGTGSLRVRASFRPVHASAIAFRYVVDLGDSAWEEDLSPLSSSLRAFKEFEAGLESRAGRKVYSLVRRRDARWILRRYGARDWEWARDHLPAAEKVHARIRPRYARLLAAIAMGLSRESAENAVAAAAAMEAFLPEDPSRYYELGNATFSYGLRGWNLAESAFLLARTRLKEGKVKETRALLHSYLGLLPPGARSRIGREKIDGVTGKTDLDDL